MPLGHGLCERGGKGGVYAQYSSTQVSRVRAYREREFNFEGHKPSLGANEHYRWLGCAC